MWKAEKFCAHSGQYNDGYEHQYEDSWSIEHISTDANGIKLKLTRYQYSLSWETPALYARFTLGETTVKSDSISAYNSVGFQSSRTSSVNITVPNEWAAKTINWTIGGYSGTLLFDCYGQFAFTVTAENSTVTVERQASPKAEAGTGELADGAAIYTGDVLIITATVPMGYSLSTLTTNGTAINSGESVAVSDDIAIASKGEPMATVDVYANGAWGKHLIYIYSGGAWGLYQAEVYSGGSWSKYF